MQRLREGVDAPYRAGWEYGGFGIRTGAYIIDSIIMQVVQLAVMAVVRASMFANTGTMGPDNMDGVVGAYAITMLIPWGLWSVYYVFFVGRFQATPGKMVCGLRIVVADGSRVSYLRALGRFFAGILSGMILGIGYLMVISDDEKRALHDRICDTRVVKK